LPNAWFALEEKPGTTKQRFALLGIKIFMSKSDFSAIYILLSKYIYDKMIREIHFCSLEDLRGTPFGYLPGKAWEEKSWLPDSIPSSFAGEYNFQAIGQSINRFSCQ
jgi:hypothetical protein